jgi:hypothetical protein
MIVLVVLMLGLSLFENLSVYSNPFRRAIMMCVTLTYSVYSVWLGLGAYVMIDEALPLL